MYIFGNSEDERLYGEFTFNRKKQSIYIPLINRNIVSKSFKLYTVTSIPRIVHRRCLEIISRLLNINIFYKKVANRSLNIDIKNILDNIYKNYSVAICVCNNNESGNYILQIMDNNSDIKAYGKLAKRKESAKFIVNENQNIEYLNKLNLESIDIPKIIYFDDINNIIIQSTRNDLKDDKGKLSINHINFFSELYQKTKTSCNFKDSSSYRHILEIKYRFNNEDINRLIDKVLNELINKYNIKKIQYCFSHHDFHKNNVKIFKDKLFVYDWEIGEYSIIYYDLFYYIYEPIIGSKNKSPQYIINSILNNKYIDKFEIENHISKSIRKQMLIIYMCEFIYSYVFTLDTSLDDNCILKSIEILNILLN